MGGDERGHVEGATNRRAAAADAPASVPLPAFAWMRSQSGQGRRLTPVERAQFGQFSQHAQGCDRADAGDGFEFLHALIQGGGLGAQRFELCFDLFQIALQPAHEALRLTPQGRQREAFDLLPLRDEDFQHLHAATDQFGQVLFLFGARYGGFGLDLRC